MTQASPSRSTRSCDGCTLCCKLFPVEPLNKPANVLCTHCIANTGCGIHTSPERPAICGEFLCGYIQEPRLGPEWKPSLSRIVLLTEDGTMVAGVDQDMPDAWRREPYFTMLRQWSAAGARHGARVLISVGRRVTQLLPDGSELEVEIVQPPAGR
ncbi:MAG TPA: hypothetical protein VGG48_06455 [Rhizomicrobium sp.]